MNEVKDNEYILDRQYNTEKYIVGETKKTKKNKEKGKGRKKKRDRKRGKKIARGVDKKRKDKKKWRGEEGTVCADSELY